MKKQKTIHRLPGTNIVIDYWKPFQNGERSIRFMTLFRIEDDQLQCMKKNDYKIYTSVINKRLLELREIPADRIVAIESGFCLEITDMHAGYSFKVSTIESNYCVGSCMFLFQGPFGNILYTGFFRPARSCDPLKDPILKSLIGNKRLDEVYIDNSYAGEHCQFPSRADVIKRAVQLIQVHPGYKVIIAGNKFGKEEILRDIVLSLNECIGVSQSKFEELSHILTGECLQKFTTCKDECRIVVEDDLLSLKQYRKKQADGGLSIIILLTAQYMCEETLYGTPAPRLNNLHILPYSSHASHCELIEFLFFLKPRKISPIILSESENTRIPKSILEICNMIEDSATLSDSDFYFDTVTSLPAFQNTYKSAPEKAITRNGSHYLSPKVNGNTLIKNRRNNSRGDEPTDLNMPSNTVDSVESDEFHEADVAFINFQDPEDLRLTNESGNDTECMIDPLSVTDAPNVFVLPDFSETGPNLLRDERTAKSPDRTEPAPTEMEVDDDSPENLIIPDCFYSENLGHENSSSQIVKNLVSEEKLMAVLYHIWLTTNVEDWQRRTNLAEDSWKDLQGAEFF